MRISQTDAIKVTDADYRAAQKAEKLVAIELAKGMAQEIGVGEHAAVGSAIWLERLIATPEDVEADDSVNASKAGPGARKTEFIKRAKALQAKHDEAAK